MTNIAIIGASGYTGFELVKILLKHPKVKIKILTSRQYKNVEFTSIYPILTNQIDLKFEEMDIEKINRETDLIFIALPHKLPMSIASHFLKANKKVIDLSADFRFKDVKLYEETYQKHTSKEILKKAVYGLCEVYRKEIKKATIIGNPGCYPTSILLPLIPIIEKDIIDTKTIIADSKSGTSGAGKNISATTHFCEVNEDFKAYKVASHRHNPEINEQLSLFAKKKVNISFVPHLLPLNRGMLSTIYANITKKITESDIIDILKKYYKNEQFIRIHPISKMPSIKNVQNTNYCDIGVTVDKMAKRLIVVSVIDNLVKGASGQAVQNMNIMMGFDETLGLI